MSYIDIRDEADECIDLLSDCMATCPECKGEGTIERPATPDELTEDPDTEAVEDECPHCDGDGERFDIEACEDPDRLMAGLRLAVIITDSGDDLSDSATWGDLLGDLKREGENYEPLLIPEDEFEDYARELASDLGFVESDQWPARHIDWEAAADELRHDYTVYEWESTTYLMRSY